VLVVLDNSEDHTSKNVYDRFANLNAGGGLWQPEAAALAKLRRDIDRKPHKIKAVLTNDGIRKAFLRGVADNEKKAVQAFANLPTNKSSALKRHPKVSRSSPTIGLSKHRQPAACSRHD